MDDLDLKTLVLEMVDRIADLEATVSRQQKEITGLEATVNRQQEEIEALKLGFAHTENKNEKVDLVKIEQPSVTTTPTAKQRTRRTFLAKIAKTGLLVTGIGLATVNHSQKEAEARVLVNPSNYPIQFGAITTPPTTNITGVLGDTNVRIGLAACGDPVMDYAKLPLFDTGVFAQGAGYGVYAITDRSMASAGYFRNIATSGVGQFYAITAISNNGTAITGTGTGSGFGVVGYSNGIGSGVDGSSNSGPGVSGFSTTGAGMSAASSTGVPLHLQISNSVPTGGTRARGDFYLDNLGKVYVWARNDANSADVWRQIPFVPA